MEFKTCTKCGETYPATEEYFYKQKHTTKKNGTEHILVNPCKECRKESTKQWQKDNPEKYHASQKEYKKKYFNIPEKRERHKEVKRNSREKGVQLDWQQKNKEVIKGYNLKRKMNKNHTITKEEWELCKKYFNFQCAYCGINETDAKEQQGQYFHKEHVDHNGSNYIENCVPSCTSCNTTKNEKEFNEWYNVNNPIYSKRRYNKIINWMTKECFKILNLI